MKFFKLLKKELRELLTVQTIIGLVVGVAMLMLLGNVMGGIGEKMEKTGSSVVIADLDKSAMSTESIKWLEEDGFTIVFTSETDPKKQLELAAASDHVALLVIPKGFGDGLAAGKPQQLEVVSSLTSFSIFNNMDESAAKAAETIRIALSQKLLNQKVPGIDIEYLNNPVTVAETTMVKDKSASVNSTLLASLAMQQSIFIPIIVFLLITFATQLNISAIANEKGDKTLETLLSTPVSRLSVLGAKMTASAAFSLLMAGVFMFGFSTYMGGMMNTASGGAVDSINTSGGVLQALGLQLSAPQYFCLGLQLFLTVCIALVISLILGALAKDLKSAQGMVTPLMFMTLIPYFITMFMDVNSLPVVLSVIVYLIPFTHTFTASANLLFGNNLLFWIGVIYQLVFLAGILFVAVRIFSSDKIFTSTISFGKKRKKDAVEQQ